MSSDTSSVSESLIDSLKYTNITTSKHDVFRICLNDFLSRSNQKGLSINPSDETHSLSNCFHAYIHLFRNFNDKYSETKSK